MWFVDIGYGLDTCRNCWYLLHILLYLFTYAYYYAYLLCWYCFYFISIYLISYFYLYILCLGNLYSCDVDLLNIFGRFQPTFVFVWVIWLLFCIGCWFIVVVYMYLGLYNNVLSNILSFNYLLL